MDESTEAFPVSSWPDIRNFPWMWSHGMTASQNHNPRPPLNQPSLFLASALGFAPGCLGERQDPPCLTERTGRAEVSRAWRDEDRNTLQGSRLAMAAQGQSQRQHSTPQGMAVASGLIRPRPRARRGQATDPHSIAERLRRERIATRIKELQEIVPTSNKGDRIAFVDDVISYVRFLQLQAKVLMMSRLGGTTTIVAPLITGNPEEVLNHISYPKEDLSILEAVREALQDSNMAELEEEVRRLMEEDDNEEEDMAPAMRFLYSKGFCLMPISVATTATLSTNARVSELN